MDFSFENESIDFEDGGLITNKCSYCNEEILGMPIHSTDGEHQFCDIACAKLYNDNVEEIEINKVEYDRYFEDGLLIDSASELYKLIRLSSFKCLPHSVRSSYSPKQSKITYSFVIRNSVK